jgi:phosphatidylglycerophosphatase A
MNLFIFLIVTFCGVGKIRFAPGTFGSLAAFPLAFCIFQLVGFLDFRFDFHNLTSQENYLITIPIVIFLSSIKVFFIGWLASYFYIRDLDDHDPSEVVIDEVAGQLFVIAFAIPSLAMVLDSKLAQNFSSGFLEFIVLFLLPFALFRFFDIIKPWPIGNIEANFPNAFGIMIDDIIAAIFAIVMHYAIIFVVLDFV